ncbi:hypothetical protein OPIT5_24160 [Opitutaceae bacterium TAV5]|nr:hypothetical protein OPIT5_24160 [Opitutaceae bacterium TAV5]
MPDLNTISPEGSREKHERIWLVLLLAITAVAFSQGIGRELVFDAASIVGGDIRLRAVTAENLGGIFTENYWYPTRETDLYRPVTTLSLFFNYSVFGNEASAAGYQVTNLLLHLLCVWMAFRLLRRLQIGLGVTVFAASMFALHPAVAEVVPNIVGRSDLLAALAVFGGLHIYLSWWEGRVRTAMATVAFFVVGALGVLSKENAAVLPGLVVWHMLLFGPGQRWQEKGGGPSPDNRKKWNSPAVYGFGSGIVLVLIIALLPKVLWHASSGANPNEVLDNPLLAESFIDGRLSALGVLGRMISAIFLPLDLSPDYSFNQTPPVRLSSLGNTATLAGILWGALVVGIGAFCLVLWRCRKRKAAFTLGAGLISFLPTANILVLVGTIRADRFMYMPALWFAAGVGLLFSLNPKNLSHRSFLIRKAALIVAVSLPILLGAITFFRCSDWISDRQFWLSAWQSAPNSFKGKLGYGLRLALTEKREDAEEARPLILEALRLVRESPTPRHPMIMSQIGGGLVQVARTLKKAGQLTDAKVLRDEAIVLLLAGLNDVRHLNEEIEFQEKENGEHYFSRRRKGTDLLATQLANAYVDGGNVAFAHQVLLDNLEVNRFDPSYLRELARVEALAGEWELAEKRLYQVLVLRPSATITPELIISVENQTLPLAWQENTLRTSKLDISSAVDVGNQSAKRSIIEATDVICSELGRYGRSGEVDIVRRTVRHKLGVTEYGVSVK